MRQSVVALTYSLVDLRTDKHGALDHQRGVRSEALINAKVGVRLVRPQSRCSGPA